MSYDFGIFEKLKEIFEGVRRNAWQLVPLAGAITFLHWLFTEWLPGRAVAVMDEIQGLIPEVNVDLSVVAIGWSRVNQWVPLNEAVLYSGIFLSIASAMIVLRWVKKFIPFG